MQNTALNDIRAVDTAVELISVSKRFEQWQRTGSVRDIVRNLLHPQKRVVEALQNVSLRIGRGEFVAYAGANGAGKSTTIKLLSGLLAPSEGQLRVLSLRPTADRIPLMRRVGVLFGQRTELWWDHPIESSFEWKRRVWDIPDERYRRMRALVEELLDLGPLMRTFARELSLGQRMRADLGMMLLHEPELLLLDEPTLGLDVLAKRQMIDFLKAINRERAATIVVTSHDMDDLEEMARRIILLSDGKIAFDGGFDRLRETSGSLRVLVLTTRSAQPPALGRMRHVETNGNIHKFEFDAAALSVREALGEAAGVADLVDLEVLRVPIEQVVAGLYRAWKG